MKRRALRLVQTVPAMGISHWERLLKFFFPLSPPHIDFIVVSTEFVKLQLWYKKKHTEIFKTKPSYMNVHCANKG
jgi:hypothetical protein